MVSGIATGAAAHSVDVMFCMSYPNVLMQSVMFPAVTHARASADSHPSSTNYVGFAGASTWIWALGTGKRIALYCSDVSGAFDKVNSQLLLQILHPYHLRTLKIAILP